MIHNNTIVCRVSQRTSTNLLRHTSVHLLRHTLVNLLGHVSIRRHVTVHQLLSDRKASADPASVAPLEYYVSREDH